MKPNFFYTDKEVLENSLVYSVFLKVWYSANIYAVFKTNGIYVMTQGPVLATVRGTVVRRKAFGCKFSYYRYTNFRWMEESYFYVYLISWIYQSLHCDF